MKQDQLATTKQSLKILETSPKEFYRALPATSIREVFKSQVPSLALCRKEFGEMHAKAILVMIITDVALLFNTGQNLNQTQIANLTEIILEDYYYLKVDDFKLCFKNAMKGLYGPVYRMDVSIILSWIEKYAQERFAEADNVSYQQHMSSKGEQNTPTLSKMIEKIEKNRKK
jgi:hypothetical protein